MLPILQVGPLAIQLPGLILLAGIWFGVSAAERAASRHGVSPAHLSNLVFYGLIGGVIGARLAYAIRFVDVYLSDPLSLISLNPSTLAAAEGALIGILVAVVYGSRRGMRLWPTLDALAPGMAVFAVALALSHLSSGDAFGRIARVPWAIEMWGARRHPTQIYELLMALIALALVLRLDQTVPPVRGYLFLLWLGITALSYVLIAGFRGDSVIVMGVLRRGQLVALAVLAIVLALMRRRTIAGRGGSQADP